MIRTVLIDDEPNNINTLQQLLLRYCPIVEIAGTADSAKMGGEVIAATQPDLVFLDIEMPYGNAFDLLNSISPITFEIVFVTAFDNYAINAIKYSALDYLLKPVDIDDLRNAINRVEKKPDEHAIVQQMKMLLDNVGALNSPQQKMAIPTITGLIFITVQDIIRFEASGNYTSIYLSSGEPVLATRTVKDYEDILPETIFCRIHNSHIINLSRIKKYQKGRGGSVEMEDGSIIEVASRRRDEFLRRLLK